MLVLSCKTLVILLSIRKLNDKLRYMGTLPHSSANITKGSNFCYEFASMGDETPLKWASTLKRKNLLLYRWEQILFYKR